VNTDQTEIPKDEAAAGDSQATKEYSVSSQGGKVNSGGLRMPDLSRLKQPFTRSSNGARATSGSNRGLLVVLLVLLAGFFGSWYGANYQSNSALTSSVSEQKKVVTSTSQLISSIAETVGPSVVSVNVTGTSSTQGDLFGFPTQQQVSAAGTGIIISKSGIVLTNRHVVPAGTESVSVTLSDGTELKDVKVLGRTNDSDSLDVAFLKINNTNGKKLTPAVLGDSSKVKVGDTVIAIGNALGQFQNTVTSGIISGYGRSVQASSSLGDSSENLDDLFQTDAAINEGNSGGPLVNMNGQVIGLNTAVAAGNAQNIGFAIPMNNITGLIKQVLDTGKLERPYLGVRYVMLTDDYAYQFNLDTKRGAYVAPSQDGTPSVLPGSPAEKAGIKEKDIITKVNGTTVDETHSLISLLGQHQPGDKVNLTVVRDTKTINISVTLGTAPSS
jgi:S1-C subfamily serine protease